MLLGAAFRRFSVVNRISRSFYSTHTKPPPYSRRTICVNNLPEGYDAANIVDSIRANPVESVTPSKNHLSVRFLSEEMARKCISNNSLSNLSLTLEEDVSSQPSAHLVAEIGFNHLSRAFRIINLQPDFDEEKMKEIIYSYLGVEYFSVGPERRQVDVRFLDIWQAAMARRAFLEYPGFPGSRVISMVEEDPNYIFPDWYPSAEDNRLNLNRIVVMSSLSTPERLGFCMDSIRNTEQHLVLFRGLYKKDKSMRLRFITEASALQFFDSIQSSAEAAGVKAYLEEDIHTVPRGVVTAISLGASRVVCLRINRERRRSIQNYRSTFVQYGALGKVSEKFSDDSPFGVVFLTYNSIFSAMRCLYDLSWSTKNIPGLGDVRINFLGAEHLVPSVIPPDEVAEGRFSSSAEYQRQHT
ncbi:uncharacterized protein BT62DRAFT_994952 [Guyanagaster necrorhizus]|uniref:Uncharacterized protein n=1 Tax=Guyanagaster necrorhizus TaxID=856835 RepID=A0A9P7VQV3_9AGAR|nr:uncharacterized protein BT62DRAFT_994952 [Guyanagaster necrorhizus MCA 3950]KAG7444927.1 hypothetical protein BT62DRAFT_994952 [Guyanagaster necrorhizus MCA 3950]